MKKKSVKNKEMHHPPDHRQEVLRSELQRASKVLNRKHVIRCLLADKPAAAERRIGEAGIMDFISNKTKNLHDAHYQQIADAWLRSKVRIALQFGGTANRGGFDDLVYRLSTGKLLCPNGESFVGRYYVYYGSYVDNEKYGIRVLEIKTDDHTLLVTDSIRDILRDDGRILVSQGVITFFDGHYPQIFLLPIDANDTKYGVTFMVGDRPTVGKTGRVERVKGTFLTMTLQSGMACRQWMMVHEPSQNADDMIAESGAFTLEQLREPGMERHRKAFEQFKGWLSKLSPDPMLRFGN